MSRTGRAVVAHGKDFEIREYPVPKPAPNTILLCQENNRFWNPNPLGLGGKNRPR